MDDTNPQNQAGQQPQTTGQTPKQPAGQTPPPQQPQTTGQTPKQPAGQTPSSQTPAQQTPAQSTMGDMPQFPAGMPGMGMPGAGGMPPPPPVDNTPANFQLGAFFKDPIKIKLPAHPDTKFDDDKFLQLLASSISLSRLEKKRIVDAVPKLQQWQVDELINIFEEEKKKFAQLSSRHVPQLEKLAKQHYEEWRDIELEEVKQSKAVEDKSQADEIRKKLGL